MRGRNIVLFLVAVLLAGGTAALVRSSLNHRPPPGAAATPAPPAPPQKQILVAAVPIARGQILRPIDLAWRPWPAAAIGAEFIVAAPGAPKPLAGSVAREPFVAGEPIIKGKNRGTRRARLSRRGLGAGHARRLDRGH